MSWTSNYADVTGEWSWGQKRQWSSKEWNEHIKKNLLIFASLTWNQIDRQNTGNKGNRHKKHHSMEISSICKEASKRWLHDLDLNEFDTIFRFRIGSKKRLWGYRIKEKFFLIWWDPFHKIYPTEY